MNRLVFVAQYICLVNSRMAAYRIKLLASRVMNALQKWSCGKSDGRRAGISVSGDGWALETVAANGTDLLLVSVIWIELC